MLVDPTGIFESIRREFLEQCIGCGLCAKTCPAVGMTELSLFPETKIQEEFYKFLEAPMYNDIARTRAMSCYQCFGCRHDCPQGLNPMQLVEIAKAVLIMRGFETVEYKGPPTDNTEVRETVKQTIPQEHHPDLFSPTPIRKTRVLLFPGCNVYKQPELILQMRALMDLIGHDWAFLPGLDHCCGNGHHFVGDLESGRRTHEKLLDAIKQYDPDQAVFWCPTCLCRAQLTAHTPPPLPIIPFFQYVLDNKDSLHFQHPVNTTATFHEPCNTAANDLDHSHRPLMQLIPGLTLKEMPHDTLHAPCCGNPIRSHYPNELLTHATLPRIQQVKDTNAQTLITTCHTCQSTLTPHSPIPTTNLLTLLLKSLQG